MRARAINNIWGISFRVKTLRSFLTFSIFLIICSFMYHLKIIIIKFVNLILRFVKSRNIFYFTELFVWFITSRSYTTWFWLKFHVIFFNFFKSYFFQTLYHQKEKEIIKNEFHEIYILSGTLKMTYQISKTNFSM